MRQRGPVDAISAVTQRLRSGPRTLLMRWLPVVLAACVVFAAAGVVSRLRGQAVGAQGADQRLIDVRYLVNDSDRLGWEIVAQGFPNFTFSQQVAADRHQLIDVLNELRRAPDPGQTAAIAAVRGWVPVLEDDLTQVQKQIANRQLAAAQLTALIGVDGEAQLIQSGVQRLSAHFTALAARANGRLYSGTLLALAATALLVAMLATLAAAVRRRAAKAARRALARSERRFRALVHHASEVVIVTDASGTIIFATESVRNLIGRQAAEVIGVELCTLAARDEWERGRRMAREAARLHPDVVAPPTRWRLTRPDRKEIVVELFARNLLGDPDVGGVVFNVRDVTARLRAEAQLRHQALHDPLTGLANRTLFEDRVDLALQRLDRRGGALAVLYLDVDGFKAINDSLGHHAGDALLQALGARLQETLRTADTAARLGGDEFACLLEDLESEDEALAVGRRLTAALAAPLTIAERVITVQASVGVAFAHDAATGAEQLIGNADLAMYQAKSERRGAMSVFHDALLEVARQRLDLREDLRLALEQDQLTLAYQPLVRLATQAVVSVEALLRWEHPRDGYVPPDRFIPIAEDSGLIVPLGRWVLDHALADLARWSVHAGQLTINVNVAPRELAEPDYPQTVAALLERHGIRAERLTLEVTESEILDDGEALCCLNALSELGVGLAIDDFGTGQSSLARLQRLPVTQVKLDRSFLAGIDESRQSATLVRSTIELGQALGLQMVAEGIERNTQLETLREAPEVQVEAPDPLGQGWFFGRPAPAAAIAELLGEARATGQMPAAATSVA